MKNFPRRARGFALILAVFLIVSLAAIGAYMLTVSNVQVASATMDEQGLRAYQAARAGLEWGAYRVLVDGVCAAGAFNLTTVHLVGFRAQVACTQFGTEIEGSNPAVSTYRITSTGCNDTTACPGTAGLTYVERQLQLTVSK